MQSFGEYMYMYVCMYVITYTKALLYIFFTISKHSVITGSVGQLLYSPCLEIKVDNVLSMCVVHSFQNLLHVVRRLAFIQEVLLSEVVK